MSGSQSSSNGLPNYPWKTGDKLGGQNLDNAFSQLFNLYNSLAGAVGIIQTDGVNGGNVAITLNWAGGETVVNEDRIVALHSPFDFTITSMDYGVGSGGGSFTVQIAIGGIPVTGLAAVNVSNENILNTPAVANNFVNQGARLDLIITGTIGAPTDSVLCINGSRSGQIPTGSTNYDFTTSDGNTLADNLGNVIEFTVFN